MKQEKTSVQSLGKEKSIVASMFAVVVVVGSSRVKSYINYRHQMNNVAKGAHWSEGIDCCFSLSWSLVVTRDGFVFRSYSSPPVCWSSSSAVRSRKIEARPGGFGDHSTRVLLLPLAATGTAKEVYK